MDLIWLKVYSIGKLCLLVASRVGSSRGSERALHSLPACPPHQHLMKYLDFAPYFNGVRERDVQGRGYVSV